MFLVILSDHLVEFLEIKASIRLCVVLDKYTVHHLQNVIVCKAFSDKTCDLLKLLESDLTGLLLVIKIENSSDSVLGSVLSSFLANYIHEFLES